MIGVELGGMVGRRFLSTDGTADFTKNGALLKAIVGGFIKSIVGAALLGSRLDNREGVLLISVDGTTVYSTDGAFPDTTVGE